MQLVLRRVGAVIALIVQCVIGTPTALSVTPSVQWSVVQRVGYGERLLTKEKVRR